MPPDVTAYQFELEGNISV